jgi:hypothetical protein
MLNVILVIHQRQNEETDEFMEEADNEEEVNTHSVLNSQRKGH